MTKQQANQHRSPDTFLAKRAEFDALLAELQAARDGHLGVAPEAVLWGDAAWLADATARMREIADQHFRRAA